MSPKAFVVINLQKYLSSINLLRKGVAPPGTKYNVVAMPKIKIWTLKGKILWSKSSNNTPLFILK